MKDMKGHEEKWAVNHFSEQCIVQSTEALTLGFEKRLALFFMPFMSFMVKNPSKVITKM